MVWQFLSGVEAWVKACSEGGLPTAMQELELSIHSHQNLYEQVTTAYTEVRASTAHDVFIWRSFLNHSLFEYPGYSIKMHKRLHGWFHSRGVRRTYWPWNRIFLSISFEIKLLKSPGKILLALKRIPIHLSDRNSYFPGDHGKKKCICVSHPNYRVGVNLSLKSITLCESVGIG